MIYAGGWSDYQAQRAETTTAPEKPAKAVPQDKTPRIEPQKQPVSSGLTFTERHRLDALPAEMERLEAEIAKLEQFLSDPQLFTTDPARFGKASEALVERQRMLASAEEEWLLLEEKASQ